MSSRPRVPVWSLKLAVGLGLLALIFTQLPLTDLSEALRSVAPCTLAVGILIGLGTRFVAAARMWQIMRRLGLPTSVFEIYGINLRSSYFSFFLPGNLAGGAARWYLLKRRGSGGADAFVGIFFDRLTETASLVAIGFAASLTVGDMTGGAALQITFMGLFASILTLQAAVFNARFLTHARRLATWLRLDRRALFTRIFDALAESSSAFHALPLVWHGRLWTASLISHAFGTVSYYFLARAAGLELALVDLAWIRSAVAMISLLPLTFAGLGVREGVMIVLLAGYGVSTVDAVAFSLLLFLALVIASACGGLLLALDMLKRRRAAVAHNSGQLP